jgi:AcrR family transcriptional regulator
MDSEKSPARAALEPQRRSGKLRVAALMQAGAAVIAERGFEAATMAEIATRAGAPIGSLYRFFPNKEILADALLQRYRDLLDQAFEEVDDPSNPVTLAEFADALLEVVVNLRAETKAVVNLLDTHSDWSEKRRKLHDGLLRRTAEKLLRRDPLLAASVASDMAVILLQNMKSMAALRGDAPDGSDGAIAELREMTRLYLASKLNEASSLLGK